MRSTAWMQRNTMNANRLVERSVALSTANLRRSAPGASVPTRVGLKASKVGRGQSAPRAWPTLGLIARKMLISRPAAQALPTLFPIRTRPGDATSSAVLAIVTSRLSLHGALVPTLAAEECSHGAAQSPIPIAFAFRILAQRRTRKMGQALATLMTRPTIVPTSTRRALATRTNAARTVSSWKPGAAGQFAPDHVVQDIRAVPAP
jgi:hypothetical protein